VRVYQLEGHRERPRPGDRPRSTTWRCSRARSADGSVVGESAVDRSQARRRGGTALGQGVGVVVRGRGVWSGWGAVVVAGALPVWADGRWCVWWCGSL